MRRPRRTHLPEFKAKVALAALKGDLTLAQLVDKSGPAKLIVAPYFQSHKAAQLATRPTHPRHKLPHRPRR
jgi:hypothetical protein